MLRTLTRLAARGALAVGRANSAIDNAVERCLDEMERGISDALRAAERECDDLADDVEDALDND